ncbi:30S ribosomal protein S15 [bacterium]|nr:30S ribosomal protein S15 [bacterium]
MAISTKEKQDLVIKFGKDAKNTGSVQSQVAIFSAEINALTEHIKNNPKDFASKRSLYRLVSKRRNLLNYLKRRDIEQYRDIVKQLDLRN